MDFPAYVPASVRAHITTLIDGDGREPFGWAASLASAEEQLSKIERAIAGKTRRGEIEYLFSLSEQKTEAVKHRDMLANNVECLQRLAHDKRMQAAFEQLNDKFYNDEQWRGFIYAAWAARMDYKYYREQLKSAKELRDEIADTSEKLARLLRKTSTVGLSDWPSELFSIPELLRNTDNHEMQDHNLCMWRSMRRHVLGDPPRRDIPESEPEQETGEPPSAHEIVIVRVILEPGEKPEIDPVEEVRNTLRYAWGTAPDLSALLDTVTRAAREFKPSRSGVIGAAIVSRQQNTKTEYLRAFGNLLTDVHHLTLTPDVMKAMAIVANVAINLPDVDVTYDDVRKSLVNRNGETLENSGGK